MFRYYHQDPYGSVGNILLEQGVPARYVAVFCAHNKGLALAEVRIYSASKYASVMFITFYYYILCMFHYVCCMSVEKYSSVADYALVTKKTASIN